MHQWSGCRACWYMYSKVDDRIDDDDDNGQALEWLWRLCIRLMWATVCCMYVCHLA